jgi:hypothetical protein
LGSRLAAAIGACAVAVSFALVGGSTAALAGTPVILYVDATLGTMTTGCTTSGSGACQTIQEGINAAEALSSSDVTVDVAAGTYIENDAILVPSGDTLTLQGAGASSTIVDGVDNPGRSIFTITSGTVTIKGFTIEDGSSAGSGGGIDNGGTVTLTNDTLSNDTATDDGGGVANYGIATLTNDTLSGDSATYGGGVYNDGTATLMNDTLSNDSAPGRDGGGVYNDNGGTASLTNDTLSGDSALSGEGGGFYNGGTATLTNDTLSGDSAAYGGGFYNYGIATLTNSILDSASCAGALSPPVTDGGYNVEDDTSCGLAGDGSTDINLAASLAANGSTGPETLAIGPNSSAYQEVPLAECTIKTDERGATRPGVGTTDCDAGAYEYQLPTLTSTQEPASAAVGATLKDSAALGNIYNLAGTGTITFKLFGPGDTGCTTPLDTETVGSITAGGIYSTPTGYVGNKAGTWNWTASYGGDSNNAVVSTSCGSEPVMVAAAAPAPERFSAKVRLSAGATYSHALVATKVAGTLTASANWTPTGSAKLEILRGGTVVDSGTGVGGVTLTYAAAAHAKYVVKLISKATVTLTVHFSDSHY